MRINRFYVLALIFLLIIVTGCDDGNVDNSEFVTAKEETITDEINSLYLEWNSGVITVEKSNDNTIHIEEKAKEDFLESNMFTTQVNGTQLKVLDPHYSHPVIMLEHDLYLTVPDKLYDEINFNGTSVQIDMDGFKAKNLILSCNTTEHNISGEFETVNSDFTSGEINYSFSPTPKQITLKGYVSNGTMLLPSDSNFSLTEELVDSEVQSDFDLTELGENKFKFGSGEAPININMDRSTFSINPMN